MDGYEEDCVRSKVAGLQGADARPNERTSGPRGFGAWSSRELQRVMAPTVLLLADS